MDFNISTRKSSAPKNTVSISKATAEHLIDLLTGVECTAVWSDPDQQYLRIHDVDRSVIDELKNAVAVSSLMH